MGGVGNDTLFGGRGNDTISGGDGDDLIVWVSGEGSDSIKGGAGTDVLRLDNVDASQVRFVLDGVDVIVITPKGSVRLVGQAASDTPDIESVVVGSTTWSAEAIRLVLMNFQGTEDKDKIVRRSEVSGWTNDTIYGNGGNDTIDAGAGNDELFGGMGDDWILGGNGIDIITGGVGNDLLYGGAGDDVFKWSLGDGNDSIYGGAGSDVLRLAGVSVNDVTRVETVGNDVVLTIRGQTLRLVGQARGDGLERIEFTDYVGTVWSVADLRRLAGNVYGTVNADTIISTCTVAGWSDNWFSAGEGNDSIDAGAGNDYVGGGDGNDTLLGGVGNDGLDGSRGDDSLGGGAGDDAYFWDYGFGNDTISDAAGNDTLTLFGVAAADVKIVLDNADIVLVTGRGCVRLVDQAAGNSRRIESVIFQDGTVWTLNDMQRAVLTVTGTSNDDTITRTSAVKGWANDTIDGGAGNDSINSGAGADSVMGGAGDDTINAGIGNDRIVGGSGNDTFVFKRDSGRDTIMDFSAGATLGDVIDLTAWNVGSFDELSTMMRSSGRDLIIAFDASTSVTLKNISMNMLHSNDFLL